STTTLLIEAVKAATHDHFGACRDCGVRDPRRRRVGGAGSFPGCPAVSVAIVGAARLHEIQSAPDDHFTASQDRRVIVSGRGRVSGTGGYPTIGRRIVSSTGVKKAGPQATPYNHFTAGPYRSVGVSWIGRIGGAGGCPTIRAWI